MPISASYVLAFIGSLGASIGRLIDGAVWHALGCFIQSTLLRAKSSRRLSSASHVDTQSRATTSFM